MNNRIKQMPNEEIMSVIRDFKHKMWCHVETKPANQVNEGFMEYAERTIDELNKILDERKIAA